MQNNILSIKKTIDQILNNFKNTNCSYGTELHDNVKRITNNFSKTMNFFDLKNNLEDHFLDFLLLNHCTYNNNIFLIIVWPVTYNFEDTLVNTYNKYGTILFKKEIKLENNGFKNILHFISDKKKHPRGLDLWFAKPHRYKNPLTVYVFQTKEINEISDTLKRDYLIKIFNNNVNHITNIEYKKGLNNLYVTTKCKRECRENLKNKGCVSDINFAPDKQYSHHVNDEHHETIEMSRIFFNNNSIFAINYCDIDYKCDSFDNKYKRYTKFISDNKWGNTNDFCLNNSSILSQYGIRMSRDIDYLHNERYIINKQIPEDEISSHNYVVKEFNLKPDDIVYNPTKHFWFKNIKFITLYELLLFKQKQATRGNQKAQNDFIMIKKFIL